MEHALAGWDNFYVIVGSSAAALTGLQFVVMTLIRDTGEGGPEEVNAFGTPIVVHFCAALLVAGILSAPWHRVATAATAVAACGLAGLVYMTFVFRRARRTQRYQPVLEDWIWHVVIPSLAYLVLVACGFSAHTAEAPTLFGIAGSTLLLVFIGIRNAWDTIIYIAVDRPRRK